MKYIGNLYTDNKISYDKSINKINNLSELNNNLPLLIIGIENAKKYIKGFNILTKRYGNTYWTFKKTERRYDYENDLNNFYKECINNIISDIKYIYFDVSAQNLFKIKNFITYLKSNKRKYSYLLPNKRFMFIFDSENRTVIGFSLTLSEYMGVNRNKIIKRINNNSNIIKVDNKFAFSNLIKPYLNKNPHYILPLFEYFTS